MNIIIREAISKDMSKVLELIKELATFEKEPDAVIVTEKQLINDGFSSSPKFKCFVASMVCIGCGFIMNLFLLL